MSKSSQEQSPTATKSTALSISERHELLATQERRRVLECLDDCQLPTDLDDLARAVEATSQEDAQTAKIGLHHIHLPKMADLGVVDYEAEEKQVTAYHPPQ